MAKLDPILVAAFYKFTRLDDVSGRVARLGETCRGLDLSGTILVAAEGINATVAGTPEAVESLLALLAADPAIGTLDVKKSWVDAPPFRRMKVRERREIITLGDADGDPLGGTGEHLDPDAWNQLLESDDVLVIDTRNRYETETGIFEGAIDPGLDVFSEFPEWVRKNLSGMEDRPIAMYCTGGIRCEKASAWMLRKGFRKVYQLDGGILRYIGETSPENSKWRGECFVFDGRITVDGELQKGSYIGFGPDGKSLIPKEE